MLREAAITRDDHLTVSVESVAVSFIILYFWVLLLVSQVSKFRHIFRPLWYDSHQGLFIVSTSRPSINMVYVNTEDTQC